MSGSWHISAAPRDIDSSRKQQTEGGVSQKKETDGLCIAHKVDGHVEPRGDGAVFLRGPYVGVGGDFVMSCCRDEAVDPRVSFVLLGTQQDGLQKNKVKDGGHQSGHGPREEAVYDWIAVHLSVRCPSVTGKAGRVARIMCRIVQRLRSGKRADEKQRQTKQQSSDR